MRGALENIFPLSAIEGCFFHFCKALWYNASKLGLKKESELKNTKILIALMKCLVHIKEQERKDIWKDICDVFKEKGPNYHHFLQYFQKNWLSNYFINFVECPVEQLRFRSNNICESFNSKLNRAVAIKHPQIGVLVDKLLDFELNYRTKHLERINAGSQSNQRVYEQESYLPFSYLYTVLNAQSLQIRRYNLRSGKFNDDFWVQILEAVNECYRFLFKNKHLDNLDSNDNANNAGN